MRNSTTGTFARILGTAAITLSLALTGCGQAATTTEDEAAQEQEEAPEATTEEASTDDASDQISIPDELLAQASVSRAIVEENDTTGADELESLGTREDEQLESLDSTDDIDVGLEDSDKAPSGKTLLVECGIQMQIPSSWMVGRDEDGYVFQDPSRGVVGYMYGFPKRAGQTYDLPRMAAAIPYQMSQMGYTNIETISYDICYSSSGKICSSYICYAATYGGVEYIFYSQFVESKSYLNCVEFGGTLEDFYYNLDDIAAATDSIAFNPGERI